MQLFDTQYVSNRNISHFRTGAALGRTVQSSARRASPVLTREELQAIVMQMVD